MLCEHLPYRGLRPCHFGGVTASQARGAPKEKALCDSCCCGGPRLLCRLHAWLWNIYLPQQWLLLRDRADAMHVDLDGGDAIQDARLDASQGHPCLLQGPAVGGDRSQPAGGDVEGRQDIGA